MNWTMYAETSEFCEYHESEAGRVEHRGAEGWDAFLYIPSKLRSGHATKEKIGIYIHDSLFTQKRRNTQ